MKKRLRKMAGWTLIGLPFVGLAVFTGLTWGMEGIRAFTLICCGILVFYAIIAVGVGLIDDE